MFLALVLLNFDTFFVQNGIQNGVRPRFAKRLASGGEAKCHGADESRAALLCWQVAKLIEQFLIVGRVHHISTTGHAGVSRAVDSGCAVQRIDFQTTVIGKARQTRSVRIVLGFEQGIAFESRLVFNGFVDIQTDILERDNLQRGVSDDRFDLIELMRVGGG